MLIHMTAAQLSKWVSFGSCVVRKIYGFNGQATDLYIQLFDVQKESATVIVSDGAIPAAGSLLVQQSNAFVYDFGQEGITLKALCVAISTTVATLTAVGVAGGVDFVIDIDGPKLVDNFPTLTIVGDLTTSVDHLQVWAEASGPNTLVQVDAKAVSGTTHYAVGYAVDTAASTNKTLFAMGIGNTNVEGDFNMVPLEKTAADQALHTGLTINAQQTQAAVALLGINMKCRAIYY